jgi:hypothetical protein
MQGAIVENMNSAENGLLKNSIMDIKVNTTATINPMGFNQGRIQSARFIYLFLIISNFLRADNSIISFT